MKSIEIYFPLPLNARITFPPRRLDMNITIRDLKFTDHLREVFSGIRAGSAVRVLIEKSVNAVSGSRLGGELSMRKLSGVSPTSGIVAAGTVDASIVKLLPPKMGSGAKLGGGTVDIKAATGASGMGGALVGERFEQPAQEVRLSPTGGVRAGTDLTVGLRKTAPIGENGRLIGGLCVKPEVMVDAEGVGGVRLGASLGRMQALRHRRLSEMDTETLSAFDGMSLRDVDYVMLEE